MLSLVNGGTASHPSLPRAGESQWSTGRSHAEKDFVLNSELYQTCIPTYVPYSLSIHYGPGHGLGYERTTGQKSCSRAVDTAGAGVEKHEGG